MCYGGGAQHTFPLATDTHDGALGANGVHQSAASLFSHTTPTLPY